MLLLIRIRLLVAELRAWLLICMMVNSCYCLWYCDRWSFFCEYIVTFANKSEEGSLNTKIKFWCQIFCWKMKIWKPECLFVCCVAGDRWNKWGQFYRAVFPILKLSSIWKCIQIESVAYITMSSSYTPGYWFSQDISANYLH